MRLRLTFDQRKIITLFLVSEIMLSRSLKYDSHVNYILTSWVQIEMFFIRKIKGRKRNTIMINMNIMKIKPYQKYFHFEMIV